MQLLGDDLSKSSDALVAACGYTSILRQKWGACEPTDALLVANVMRSSTTFAPLTCACLRKVHRGVCKMEYL